MDAQAVTENLEKAGHETALKIAPVGDAVSDETFEYLVRQALDAVHGTMLFKMRIGEGDDCNHVAAASIGVLVIAELFHAVAEERRDARRLVEATSLHFDQVLDDVDDSVAFGSNDTIFRCS